MREIDSRELSEWQAFYNVSPFGDDRADLRAGTICSTIHSSAGKFSKKSIPPADFMPFLSKPETPAQSPEEQQSICRAVSAALGQSPPARRLPS